MKFASVPPQGMYKRFVFADEVREGDTVCFANPASEVTIERISTARSDGSVGLHGNNGTWTCFYAPKSRVRIRVHDNERLAAA